MTSLLKFVFRHNNIVLRTECKRYAGHSKWANIRHTKMAKDGERATALRMFINKMKIAVAEGRSSKPEENIRLARIIDEAKKKSMPMATIKNFLEKLQKTKGGSQSAVLEARGTSGCVVLIHVLTENVTQTKNLINTHLRKTAFSPCDLLGKGTYEQKGIILAEIDERDMDKVTDDAIEAGAEDAEKLEEDDKAFLQFTCSHSELYKVRNTLEGLNYKIIQAEVEYIPLVYVKLSDEELERISKLYERLSNHEEIVKVYNNVAFE